MGQESLTRFDQPKKEKNKQKPKSAVEIDRLAKIKLSQTTKPANTTHPVQAKETCNNKKTNNYY
jgi:hypothetical protein